MTVQEHLVPVSFHLRNFNKYRKLDLPAAENGNLTLIGENAAGKTTLANCFFPMLIDGSIATPSFNSAKGTDKLDRTTGPRNSAQDTRTFNSMLLDWGPGAMKVRTGYSYLYLRSKRRQVILGIGAYRNVSEKRQPTWWFVGMTTDVATPLTVVTTDKTGASLNLSDFLTANQNLGEDLHVFKTVEEYHAFVAGQVYGFSDKSLTKLASVYRLLASPILTGGDVRFTPIREALKNAQEGIDSQIIQAVASAQREVNRTKGSLKRVRQAQERLRRMKKEIFWRNLNRIEANMLRPYSASQHQYKENVEQCEQAEQRIKKFERELKRLTVTLKDAATELAGLRQERANQNNIVEQRKQYENRLLDLERRLKQFRKQRQRLAVLEDQATALAKQLSQLETRQEQLNKEQLQPLLSYLATHAAEMPELTKVVTEVDASVLLEKLTQYIREQRRASERYREDERAKKHVSQDVRIVMDMRETLDGRIDQRVSALQSRTRKDLHQDNQEVHDAGATKMTAEFQQFSKHQAQLLQEHADLKVNLTEATRLDELAASEQKLTKVLADLATAKQDQQRQAEKQSDVIGRIQEIQADTENDFDEQQVTAEIAETQQRHDALVIDNTIDEKIRLADLKQSKVEKQQREFLTQKAADEGKVATIQVQMNQQQQALSELKKSIETALEALAPYQPEQVQLATVEEVLAFVQQHASEVRNNRIDDLTSQISKLIHRNNQDGIDRNALDTVFEERGHSAEASAMRQNRSVLEKGLTVVAFDINQAIALMVADEKHIEKALEVRQSGNDTAQTYYLNSAIITIAAQYRLITGYNRMLGEGLTREQNIKLKVSLTPANVSPQVIEEACNPRLNARPELEAEVQNRLQKLADDSTIADDDEAFMERAQEMLDTRQWSDFKVLIKRRQSDENHYEEVNDNFVKSGGSGAEKAQAMVLPLLLVPRMVLEQASQKDAPHLVMFDEFADKLDPETAKSFAKTIARFGFNFIATMPGGAQNKILADGVDNIAYEVISPNLKKDNQFHLNKVRKALVWGPAHESVS